MALAKIATVGLLCFNVVAAWNTAGLAIGDVKTASSSLFSKRQAPDPADLYPEYNLTTPIDHFHNISAYAPHSNGTFPNRYWFDAQYYKEGGPVIVLASGETSGVGRLAFLQKGMIAQLAKVTGGIAVVLEHRYYGTSIPTPDFSTENLRWLTHEQAMADTAYFAKNVKFAGLEHLNLTAPNTPYILYGGSYAGAFVSFLRVVYPDLFWGAISSSGVTKSIWDYWEYFEPIRVSADQECVRDTQVLTNVVDNILLKNNSAENVAKLKSAFFLPNVTENADFANALTSGITQWQGRNWDPEVGSPAFDQYCTNLTASDVVYPDIEGSRVAAEELIELGGWGNETDTLITPMLNYIGYVKSQRVDRCRGSQDSCFGNYNMTFYEQDDLSQDWRLWPYQYCTQWGYLQTGSGVPETQLPLVSRLIDLEYSSLICKYAFNITTPPDTDAINKWGGFDIEYSRLAFIDGEADPWKEATPHATKATPRRDTIDEPFLLIGGQAVHHWDENGLFKNETTAELPPQPVKEAQAYERHFVKAWLKEWKREQKKKSFRRHEAPTRRWRA